MIRRVFFTKTEGKEWTANGGVDYDDETEIFEKVPVYEGIGTYARPIEKGDAILVHVGAAEQRPVVIANRDTIGRDAYVDTFGEIAAGEVAIYPGTGDRRILIKTDGTICIEDDSGTAQALAFNSEVQHLTDKVQSFMDLFDTHTHNYFNITDTLGGTGNTTFVLKETGDVVQLNASRPNDPVGTTTLAAT